jgi:hypothetical protein
VRRHRIEEGLTGDDGRGQQRLEALQTLFEERKIESLRRIHSP